MKGLLHLYAGSLTLMSGEKIAALRRIYYFHLYNKKTTQCVHVSYIAVLVTVK